jgi:lauroyl/myristoyl acyltransferase
MRAARTPDDRAEFGARGADRHQPGSESLNAAAPGPRGSDILPRPMTSPDLAAESPASDSTAGKPVDRPIPSLTVLRIKFVRGFLVAWMRTFGLSGLYLLGQIFGTMEYLVDYRRRGRVRAKLREYFKDEFPSAWHRRMTQRYFMRIRCDKMFYTIMDRIPRAQLMSRIKLIHGGQIDDALAREKGVYFALCHFGSHLIAGLMMQLLGYEIAGVRDAKESHVRRYIQNKYRETFPEVARMKLFYSPSFPRALYRHLQDNGIVASLLDAERRRGDTTKTQPVTIFGETREFLIGPVQLALRCGSTIMQGFVVSRKNFYFQLVCGGALIDPDAQRDDPETVACVMQTYADGVEQFARAHPDHLMNI